MPDVRYALAVCPFQGEVKRDEWLELLSNLNQELRERGGVPSYDAAAAEELLTDDEVRQCVGQTLRDLMALREWS